MLRSSNQHCIDDVGSAPSSGTAMRDQGLENHSTVKKIMKEALITETHVAYSSFQEALNCVSMIFPSLACLWFILYHPSTLTRHSWILILGTFLHLPFSMTYHGLCAVGNDSEFWKRLDLSLIHVVSCIYAYALSNSPLYFAANVVVNIRHICTIWAKTGRHKAERSSNIMQAVALYLLPILFSGDVSNFSGAVLTFVLGGFLFQINFLGGYGHSLFHAIFIGFQYYLISATQKVGVGKGPNCF